MPPHAIISSTLVGISAARADERSTPRQGCHLTGAWRRLGAGPATTHDAEIVNASATGLGLNVGEAVKPGSLLAMKLDLPDARFQRPVILRVIHCIPRKPDGHYVGCAFTCQLTGHELGCLLSRAQQAKEAQATSSSGVAGLATARLLDPSRWS